ncbi:MAG: hypothetical protein NC250_09925, partial [Alistipes senegalensis]|nr:hypothetical protein [Alistipes senegalensis]
DRPRTGRRWYRSPLCICVLDAVSFFDALDVTSKNSGTAAANGDKQNTPASCDTEVFQFCIISA